MHIKQSCQANLGLVGLVRVVAPTCMCARFAVLMIHFEMEKIRPLCKWPVFFLVFTIRTKMKKIRLVVSVITLHFSFDVSLTTLDLILLYNKSGISHLRHFRIENLSYNPPSHQAWGEPTTIVATFFFFSGDPLKHR